MVSSPRPARMWSLALFMATVAGAPTPINVTDGASAPVNVKDDAACSMTDTGANVWKVEMFSTHASQPYKEIHCRFQGSDALVAFTGSDKTGQCDHCVRSSGYSATCGCKCPPSSKSCSWTFYGHFQFDPKTNGTGSKSCTCNGRPGPPIPPAPPPVPPAPPVPGPCKAKLDVVVVLDGSASIGASDWKRALAFTDDIVGAFTLAADQTKIAVVQFSSFVRTVIGLSDDASAIKRALSRERQMRDMTNTHHGFERAKSLLDTQGRAGVKGKLVILLTDGAQDEGLPAKGEAVALQSDGATIFGIGVGKLVDTQELQSWVSQPVGRHYFAVSAFADLAKILAQVVADACPHE